MPIFFVISGFLISASWQRTPTTTNYVIRRTARIFPGLWCCIIATAAVAAGFGFLGPIGQTLTWLVTQMAGLIYTPSYMTGFGVGAYNTSLWTIPIELQFYVVLPILLVLAARLRIGRVALPIGFVAFLAIATALYWTWLPPLGSSETGLQKLVRYSFVPHFYMFLAGATIREYGLHRTKIFAGAGLWWLLGYAVYLAIVPHDPLHHPVGAIGSRLILSAAVISCAYTLPELANKTLRNVDISYGIYIYHGLLINILIQLGYMHRQTGLLIVVIATVAIATLSWFGIEKPVLKLAHGLKWRASSGIEAPQDKPATGIAQ